jgi:hypothetical protein
MALAARESLKSASRKLRARAFAPGTIGKLLWRKRFFALTSPAGFLGRGEDD